MAKPTHTDPAPDDEFFRERARLFFQAQQLGQKPINEVRQQMLTSAKKVIREDSQLSPHEQEMLWDQMQESAEWALRLYAEWLVWLEGLQTGKIQV